MINGITLEAILKLPFTAKRSRILTNSYRVSSKWSLRKDPDYRERILTGYFNHLKALYENKETKYLAEEAIMSYFTENERFRYSTGVRFS